MADILSDFFKLPDHIQGFGERTTRDMSRGNPYKQV